MRVLDLFAGSGALGFEALSRGAASATLVEAGKSVAEQLRATAKRFELAQALVVNTDAPLMLDSAAAGSYDLIFLDPPFASGLLAPCLARIEQREVLAPGGFCYVESAANSPLPTLPQHWLQHRSGKAGEVGYHLLHVPPSPVPRNI
jgi:16S rRNA (guanine966-N2)-methyltransferase